jgi:hypothetical protein
VLGGALLREKPRAAEQGAEEYAAAA